MLERMNAKQIRFYVTPFVIRYLISLVGSGQDVVTRSELLSAGIGESSVVALVQTRRLQEVDETDTYKIVL